MFRLTTLRAPARERRSRRIRATRGLVAAAIGIASMGTAPGALADVSATSPTGMISISTPGPVLTGVAEAYTVTVTNVNSTSTTQEQLGIQLPPGMTLNHLDANCQRSNNPILAGTGFTCGWLGIGPGQSVSATFTATATGPNTYVAQLNAGLDAGGTPPTTVTHDSLNYSIPASPGPTDIQVTGSSNSGSPPVGSQFVYSFQVKDNGPQAAYGVTFDDPLPPSINAASVSSDNGRCSIDASTNSVHCEIGLLGVGGQSNIAVTASAQSTAAVTNTASVAMQGPDPKPANNSVGVTIKPR